MKRPRTITRFTVFALALSGVLSGAAWPDRTTNAFAPSEHPVAEATTGKVEAEKVLATFDQIPLQFVENRGQLDSRVAFYAQGRDTTVYFTPRGVTFGLTGAASGHGGRGVSDALTLFGPAGLSKSSPTWESPQQWTLKLDFVNANPLVRVKGQDATATVTNFFKGRRSQWQTGLASYATVVYENLWPGIDLVYSGSTNGLKYQFVVHSGADPDHIKLAYRGASSVRLNPEGQLAVTTPVREFQDDAPYSYQEVNGQRVEVKTSYELEANATKSKQTYGFRVTAYDKSKTLIIDPAVLIYAGYIGGEGDERGLGVAVDSSGNTYVTGATSSSQLTFPVTEGLDQTFDGVQDSFVVKLNKAGTAVVYASYIGGTGDDVGFDIVVDSAGNAYVTGATSSTESSFPVSMGPDLSHNGGIYDAFVAKLNAAGTALLYCGYIGGTGEDGGAAIAVSGGYAYVTGGTSSSEATFPVSFGPDLTHNGGLFLGDAFIAKVNPAGVNLRYCGYIGGSGEDVGLGIALDRKGNVYIAGGTTSDEATFPVAGGPDLTFNGGFRDAFVAKVDAAGASLVYAGYIGGAGGDTAFGIAVDGAGNAYVTGDTASSESSFPATVGPDLTYNGGGDAFVAKINPAGTSLVYCGYLGGAGRDGATDVRVDAGGNAYIVGATSSSEATFPVTVGPALIFNASGAADAFVAKVKPTGATLDYCGYVGGNEDDLAYALALDGVGNIYVTGETSSSQVTFPVAVGPDLTYNGGRRDAFVAKIGTPPNSPPNCRNARPSLARLWPPNHEMVAVSVLGVTDPDGDQVSIRIDSIRQNEPTKRRGDDNDARHSEEQESCPDAQGVGTSTATLRAERNGNRKGRVYTIFFTAKDGKGGSCQGHVKVCVPHNTNGKCADDGPGFDSTLCLRE